LLVDGPDLRFTVLAVQRFVDVWDEVELVSRSDLMKPFVPLCLTLDHPFDWFSSTSTLVLSASVLTMLLSVDDADLRFTVPVVLRVAIA